MNDELKMVIERYEDYKKVNPNGSVDDFLSKYRDNRLKWCEQSLKNLGQVMSIHMIFVFNVEDLSYLVDIMVVVYVNCVLKIII